MHVLKEKTRRDFLKFLGRSAFVLGGSSVLGAGLSACGESKPEAGQKEAQKPFTLQPLPPSLEDQLQLATGLSYQILLSQDEAISDNEKFGDNCDYLAFMPLDPENPKEGLLWSNHEYLNSLFVSGFTGKDYKSKTPAQVEAEMLSVGGSIIHIRQGEDGKWAKVMPSEYNRRITGKTMIPFAWDEPIAGAKEAMGTLGNCAGGVTPWGTVLTCEENYDMFYGENYHKDGKVSFVPSSYYGWELFNPQNKPEHYGWVVEVDLRTGAAKKLIALGRCAHECATTFQAPDGRVVVYTGDDHNDECLYKFISDKPKDLSKGKLYVANIERGEWLSLVYEEQEVLQKNFKNQTEVLIRLREAAKLVGATPLNRPEDIEIDPLTGAVFISLTNNKPKGDLLGQILKIEEANNDKTSLKFKASTFLTGGKEFGFACPDNLAFDAKGNLWFTSDIAGYAINKEAYEGLGNNGLFVVPVQGPQQGQVIRVANAPVDAELTGPCFSPDGRSLFVSVQHPGEESKSLEALTSNWPSGKPGEVPRSSVIVIQGETLEKFTLG